MKKGLSKNVKVKTWANKFQRTKSPRVGSQSELDFQCV